MTFGEALIELKNGKIIRRKSWDNYRYITLGKSNYKWVKSQYNLCAVFTLEDFLANDWEVDASYLLSAEEFNYLKALIEPFKDEVICIYKGFNFERTQKFQYICVTCKQAEDTFTLPRFRAGKRFFYLPEDREFTPKELGLVEDE